MRTVDASVSPLGAAAAGRERVLGAVPVPGAAALGQRLYRAEEAIVP